MGERIISTCLNITNKRKDNPKDRKGLALICSRPTLVLGESEKKPCAPFSLKPKRKKQLMKWLKNLQFLDGYVVGFRMSVNLKTSKFSGLKSHEYHIIIERLLPVMFWGFVKNDVWKALVELSYFCRHLCAKEIKKEMMEKVEQQIPVLVCKLEKKYFLRVSSIRCNIYLFTYHTKL
jgi:hypothetical protein